MAKGSSENNLPNIVLASPISKSLLLLWCDSSCIIVCEQGTPSYGAVVLLIRNPYHAMVAEWNREAVRAMRKLANATTPQPQDTIHTGSVGPEHFG